jgi:hypothetical protein
VRGAALEPYVMRWLDLYRWEFPLPDRTKLADAVERWVKFCSREGALEGDTLRITHPLVRALSGVLENFREAYLTAATAFAAQNRWPVPRRAILEDMRRQFRTSLLLGNVHKPEGNSVVTFGNAISRFAELGYVRLGESQQGRDRWIERGAAHDELPALIDELRAAGGA